ncbi:hypothetical protein HPB49_017062 [Dermacentor silvarum]|uniref:Uncharacterized protein n=1 Tax=Dermacentor silvarum TaxID=543639 RepID=A0ACB8DQC4_DERSI|nr:hypothetical protein HPB49_017062 [Dermacentor silvarum]
MVRYDSAYALAGRLLLAVTDCPTALLLSTLSPRRRLAFFGTGYSFAVSASDSSLSLIMPSKWRKCRVVRKEYKIMNEQGLAKLIARSSLSIDEAASFTSADSSHVERLSPPEPGTSRQSRSSISMDDGGEPPFKRLNERSRSEAFVDDVCRQEAPFVECQSDSAGTSSCEHSDSDSSSSDKGGPQGSDPSDESDDFLASDSFTGPAQNGRLATNITIKWFPAHAGNLEESVGPNRNEEADREAHALTRRGLPSSLPDMREADPTEATAENENSEEFAITKYGEVLQWYRASRNKYPPPHRDLTRKEATTFRLLQARAIWTPVWAKHVCPEIYHTDTCQRCKKARATQSHILWECSPPAPNTQDIEMPDKIGNKITSTDLGTQRAVVQHVLELLDRQKPETSSRSWGNG